MLVRILLAIIAISLLAMIAFPEPVYADSPYLVQPGDTLSEIAARFSTSVRAIMEANELDDPDLIVVGQVLNIPGVSSPSGEGNSSPPPQRLQTAPPSSPNSVLGNNRLVTYYGHPNDARMGILGQLSKQQLVEALKRRAAMYQKLSDRPVLPAIHFVATVAQEYPGVDGKHRSRTTFSLVQEYVDLAAENGLLVILDLQIGHSTIQEELAPWLPLLRRPHVHLAIDPEFDMWPGQIPGEHFGHTTAAEVNYAQQVLNDLVVQYGLPDKVLILHQFTPNMLPDKNRIQPYPHVQIVTDMDGFGSKALKLKHYRMFVHDELIEYAGIKLFFDQDRPLMTPEEVMNLDPVPDVIIYQ